MQPIAIKKTRRALTRVFILRLQMMKAGRMVKVKSVMMVITLSKYTRDTMMLIGMHLPGCDLSQKYDTGWHWNSATKKKAMRGMTENKVAA